MHEPISARYRVGSAGSADVAVIDGETGEHAPFYDLRGNGDKADRAATVAASLNSGTVDRDSFVWKG